MKFVNAEQERAHQHAVIVGGAKGFFGGLSVALPASYLLYKRSAYYRALQPSLKAFGIIIVAVPAFVITAEKASLAFEKAQWDDVGKVELDTARAREQKRWDSLDAKQKAADFAMRHQFSIITGSWAASMLGAYAWVSRDPLATPLQKITQTRVWAQGLTLGILLSAAVLTHGRTRKDPIDHSWQDILAQEEAEEKRKKESS